MRDLGKHVWVCRYLPKGKNEKEFGQVKLGSIPQQVSGQVGADVGLVWPTIFDQIYDYECAKTNANTSSMRVNL